MEDNELYELDKTTAQRYGFAVTPDGEIRALCAQHNLFDEPRHFAIVRTPWDVLEFIERHELEAHGAARPVPYLPADATTVLPVLNLDNVNTAPAVRVVAVPPGYAGATLAAAGLQLCHRSARPVVVRSTRMADGSHTTILPADGFPGATWTIRTPPPPAYVAPTPAPATGPAVEPLTCGHPVPDRWISTGCIICRAYINLSGMEPPRVAPYRAEDHAADVCGRCGGWVKTDPRRDVLPPPYGSLNAAHPLTLCGSCGDGLVALVGQYVTDGLLDAVTAPAAPARHGNGMEVHG